MPKFLTHLFQGIGLGIAEIIPGVSGSTIALLLGIYDDFIDLLYQGSELAKVLLLWVFRQRSWADVRTQVSAIKWQFGISLAIGMLLAIVTLSSLITVWLVEYPSYLYAVLVGLTIPAIMIVWKQLQPVSIKELAIATATGAGLIIFFSLSNLGAQPGTPNLFHLFFGGVIGVSAMVLPGVSGSFVLLILGLYTYVIGLIARISGGSFTMEDITSLLVLAAGLATGLITTVRVLKHAFKNHRQTLMAFLLGLLLASWYVLWPFVIVLGVENGEPILQAVNPTVLPIAESMIITGLVFVTGLAATALHNWADNKDSIDDDGFDRV